MFIPNIEKVENDKYYKTLTIRKDFVNYKMIVVTPIRIYTMESIQEKILLC